MPVELRLIDNTYFDSVYLMSIGGRLAKQPGVRHNAVLMATPANHELLVAFGVQRDALAGAGPTDLALVVDAETAEQGQAALALVDVWLQESGEELPGETAASLDGARQLLPDANLAVISVPGEYAAYEARRALEKGLHVFLFSDNVSLDDELELKQLARERGLLVMGPDCGTAIISGAGVGFANVVRRGSIGVVGPSGTGIQQVSCLIDAAGAGISHAIGTGSRDLSDAIGGITTLQALDALAEDEQTAVIVLVSKPAGPRTRQKVLDWIGRSPKPVVTCFLGLEETPKVAEHHVPAARLEEAAGAAMPIALKKDPLDVAFPTGLPGRAAIPTGLPGRGGMSFDRSRVSTDQRYVRGLFAGGTFCFEAQQIFLQCGLQVCSNAPLRKDLALTDPLRSEGHSLIDLGDDLFTRGRPHPMIDSSLRSERLLAEASDPEVLIILLDFVLGYGAASDPAGDLAPAIREAQRIAAQNDRELAFIASVCGTYADPQGLAEQVEQLKELGVEVAPSTSQAALSAARLAQFMPLLPPPR